eukprot:CAMPEP_0115125288 /NCGR_PEP_ID=MMETSP0227-20121206/48932_1 /TAXON_ID=89957 /ORGANISM="Polarella glacialis, Strain CCMP 1383" /LENGTH=71 /DNA_ID=CAMNT_0002528589 /DNA_START=13 /DNA_END=228 /DNA_ORIENTATION=-
MRPWSASFRVSGLQHTNDYGSWARSSLENLRFLHLWDRGEHCRTFCQLFDPDDVPHAAIKSLILRMYQLHV